jgi:hypothetical protein
MRGAVVRPGGSFRPPNLEDKRSHLSLSLAGRDLNSQVAPKALELENRLLASLPRPKSAN